MTRAIRLFLSVSLLGFGLAVLPARAASLAGSTLAWAAPPQSEQAGESSAGEHEILFKVINFVILVGALGYLLRKPLRDFFTGRRANIQRELEEGRKALEAAEAELRAVEEKLGRLEQEIAALKTTAAQDIAAERHRVLKEAGEEAERILTSARARLEAETRAARQALRAFTADQSLKLAEQMIRERLDDRTRRELVRQFTTSLEAKAKQN